MLLLLLLVVWDRDVNQALDAEALGGLDEGHELLLGDADLAAVHVPHQELHQLLPDLTDHYDGVLMGRHARKQGPEVGRARGENHPVHRVCFAARRYGTVHHLLRQAEGRHHLAEGGLVVVPF